MRVGVFGGTFDPVHLGHLIMAEQCREQAMLDLVLFIPAASPPHKQRANITPFGQRVEMLALAFSGNPCFQIDELEQGRQGPSYTVDTLTQLKQTRPGDEFFLILGSDSIRDFPSWYEPRRILDCVAKVLVVERPAAALPPDAFYGGVDNYQSIMSPLIDIASRDIRQRISRGQSIRYMIPRAVEAYIADKRLYQP
jgi:nicotinate-nucleotide adenylyltransferase